MIEETAQKLLGRWGMVGAKLTLIAERENIVFRADHHTGQYALRLHRPGYQSAAMISSIDNLFVGLITTLLVISYGLT